MCESEVLSFLFRPSSTVRAGISQLKNSFLLTSTVQVSCSSNTLLLPLPQAELKKLYTQLQIYKTKTMRKDNPHISKRRGGRKQTHRRFSLQAFHHKHRHHQDHDHDHEMSKTPEESTNSAEGMAFTIEPSVKEEPSEAGLERDRDRDRDRGGRSRGDRGGGGGGDMPSVSFKTGR